MSELSFSIRSSKSDRELVFSEPRRDHFVVELRGTGLSARHEVYAYAPAGDLASFFSTLAAFERPWSDTQSWQSLEQELSLAVTCSALGHVTFEISIREHFGGPEDWRVSASLETELGRLPNLAAKARPFFEAVR